MHNSYNFMIYPCIYVEKDTMKITKNFWNCSTRNVSEAVKSQWSPFLLHLHFHPPLPTHWTAFCMLLNQGQGRTHWLNLPGDGESHWLPWIWRKQHQGTWYHCRVIVQTFSCVSILIYHIYFAPPVCWVLKWTGGIMVEKNDHSPWFLGM